MCFHVSLANNLKNIMGLFEIYKTLPIDLGNYTIVCYLILKRKHNSSEHQLFKTL